MTAPLPMTLSRTSAPASITAPSNTTLDCTVAPAPTWQSRPIVVPPCTIASAATTAPGSSSASPTGPGSALDATRPRTRSHEPCTKAAGVPRSSQ